MTRALTSISTIALALLCGVAQGYAQEPARPASVEVTPASVEVAVGETRARSARGLDAQSRPIAGAIVRWFSANPDIATVDEAGVVTAVRPGQAQVAAIVNGVAGFASVTV